MPLVVTKAGFAPWSGETEAPASPASAQQPTHTMAPDMTEMPGMDH